MANELTPIFIKDDLSDAYVAFFKENMEVISQGKTKEEALTNLKFDMTLVEEFKKSLKENGKEV